MVVVVLGILSVVALPKMLNNPSATLDVQAKAFASDLRRAQLLASTQAVSVCVLATVNTNTYRMVYQCAQPNTSQVKDPATGQAFVGTFTNGVAFSVTPGQSLEFNSLGQPNLQTPTNYVIVPANGAMSFHVSVTPLTGYVSTTVTTP